MNDTRKPAPIGRDVKKVIAFRFGMYRYQAEHFDHNEKRDTPPEPDLLVIADDPMKRGTKIYRFIDFPEYNRQVAVVWDPEEYGKHFLSSRYDLPPLKREHVDHGYPECKYPYDRCPSCGGELDDSLPEIESAEDVFNARSGWGPDGEWSSWEEIHRCPHCGKRFFIEEST